jgi:hypothetical protein
VVHVIDLAEVDGEFGVVDDEGPRKSCVFLGEFAVDCGRLPGIVFGLVFEDDIKILDCVLFTDITLLPMVVIFETVIW